MGKHSLSVALAALLAAGTARGASSVDAPVSVAFQDCEPDPLGDVAFLLALGVELDQNPMRDRDDDSPAPIDVQFRCDGVALIRIRLDGASTERAVRFDDVSRAERPRALALVVAELYRSVQAARLAAGAASDSRAAGSSAGGQVQESLPAVEARPTSKSAPRTPPLPVGPSGATESADGGVRDSEPGLSRWQRARPRVSAGMRSVLDGGLHYGVGLGVELPLLRLQAEALFARTTRARGTISSGIAAARAGHQLRLISDGALDLHAVVSAALGATWATGESRVVGTIVREVLIPYADARFGLAAALPRFPALHPDLELYGGRAAGILARADGEPTQATGGWFAGLELGASF